MDVKTLLQPTIAKVLLLLALFALFVPFIEYDTGIRCFTTPCPASALGSIASFAIFIFQHSYVKPYIYAISIPTLIAGAVLSYIAACSLVFLYFKPVKKG